MIKKIFSKVGNALAFVWKNNKVFLFTTIGILAVIITISIVVTQTPFISNTFNMAFGEERRVLVSGDPSTAQYYKTSDGITDKKSALKAANDLCEKVGEEGYTLLKNDSSLPLSKNAKVSVFGFNSVDLVYGGAGSSVRNSDDAVDLYRSLSNANIDYNKQLKDFYDGKKASGKGRGISPGFGAIVGGFPTGELSLSEYANGSITGYIGDYTDAALVVFSRIGGEGFDLPRTSYANDGKGGPRTGKIAGREDETQHYLELDDYERALLSSLCATDSAFSNVVIIINSGTTMELGFLDDAMYNGKIKSAIWIGNPGGTSLNALGQILVGDVNPSGRTVDTFAKDFTADPTWQNFGTNLEQNGNVYHINGGLQEAKFVEYEEGIYVGYRYYETRGYTESTKSGNYSWYNDAVMYPLGHGLSYSEFSWSMGDVKLVSPDGAESPMPATLSATDKDKSIKLQVKVKNNSTEYDGKEVVQLYINTPYNIGGTEKAHVVLADFDKIDVAKGEEGTATLTVKLSNMVSYDYESEGAYVLDSGNYKLCIGKNAHNAWTTSTLNVAFSLSDKIVYENDTTTDTKIDNRFDDVSGHITKYLSRNDWDGSFPTKPEYEDRSVDEDFIYSMTEEAYIGKSGAVDKDKKWYKAGMPKQQRTPLSEKDTTVKLYDLIDKDYDDKLWDELLNQLTIKEMCYLVGSGNYNTAAIKCIDKPKTLDPDGPVGFTNFITIIDSAVPVYDTCFYVSPCVVGATWNKDLAYEMGVAVGNEGLIGNERGDERPYSGWYAPAVNIHRSPFSGRNWEYYSEDGFLSGKMSASIIQGAKSKGVYCYVKHFALNDQETDRDQFGLITWANEQSMRELYFKPFEISVKEGETTAIMSSFNRIGTVWAGGSYELLTEVLREEWGFTGMVITDYNVQKYMGADQMIRAGGDLNLFQDKQPVSSGKLFTTSHTHALRNATKNILYTVAKSNAMNGMGPGIVYRYALPYWQIIIIVFDVVVAVGLAVWGFFAIRHKVKKRKLVNNSDTI